MLVSVKIMTLSDSICAPSKQFDKNACVIYCTLTYFNNRLKAKKYIKPNF